MKVTICQLHDAPDVLKQEWNALVEHVQAEKSALVVLPEMPFYPWMAATDQVEGAIWGEAVQAHDEWETRLSELGAKIIVGSRPAIVAETGTRHNIAFVAHDGEIHYVHTKYYLPNEDGFWEAKWYERGGKHFDAVQYDDVTMGFMICTDLWFTEHARSYGRQGAHFVINPRATEKSTIDKWLLGGRATAIASGAYCLSSNHCGECDGVIFGGTGWVIDPNGNILATTSDEQPFVTIDVDLEQAVAAKATYPRYVLE